MQHMVITAGGAKRDSNFLLETSTATVSFKGNPFIYCIVIFSCYNERKNRRDLMKKINLTVLATTGGGCSGSTCPTVYQSSDGRFFVQGYVTSDEIRSQANLADNETLVEINMDLLKNLVPKIQ